MSKHQLLQVLLIGPLRTASFEIGLLQPFKLLQQQGLCQYEICAEKQVRSKLIARADIVIFSRTTKPELYRYLRKALLWGKKTVYVIDDHFAAMASQPFGSVSKGDACKRTYEKFLTRAHIIKVASPYFAKVLQHDYRLNRVVCFSGSIDFNYFTGLYRQERSDGKLMIGYAGGKKERAFHPLVKALRHVLREYGDKVELHFYGYIPAALQRCEQIVHHGYVEGYAPYIRKLYSLHWDIALAPLELGDSLPHDCKTDNKFREYASCHMAGIYSDSPAYRHAVQHGETGLLLANSVQDWYEAIIRLVEDEQLRTHIANRAAQVARERYSVEQCARRWYQHILQGS